MLSLRTPAIAGAIVAALAGTTGYCAFNAVPTPTPVPIIIHQLPAPVTPGLIEPLPEGPVDDIG